MSLNTSNVSLKQRKLNDLRVIDIQKELQNFGIQYDKKELKGALIEKLKQALINRNLDPDRYVFNENHESKSLEPEQHKQNMQNENTDDIEDSDGPQLEIDPEPLNHDENLVKNTIGSSSATDPKVATTSVEAMNEDSQNQANPLDTIDLKQTDENPENQSIFLVLEELSNQNDDAIDNENLGHSSSHTPSSTPDRDLQADVSYEQERDMDDKYSTSPVNDVQTTADSDQQTLFDSGLNEFQLQSTSTEEKSNDDSTTFKSDSDRNQVETTDGADKETKKQIRRDQCHLWVSNIAKETHAAHLKELFSKHGKVLATKVISSSSSQWFGYITMATPEDVEKCINALHQTELHGKNIYVDWDMHDSSSHSSLSRSKTDRESLSTKDRTLHSRSNEPDYRITSKDSQRDTRQFRDRPSIPRKRPSSPSSSNDTTKRRSSPDRKARDEHITRSNNYESFRSRSKDQTHSQHRNSSNDNRHHSSRNDFGRDDTSRAADNSDTFRSTDRSKNSDRRFDRPRNSSPSSKRPRPEEPRSSSSSSRYSSSVIEKSRAHSDIKKHERNNDSNSKDYHRISTSNNFDSSRRSNYHQDDYRSRHDKDLIERQQYARQQEEESLREQQRRIAEERERFKREFELLERERLEVERTRLALEKEKQDQAREIEKQRRLTEETRLRDEKLHRLAHGAENKKPRPSQLDSQKVQHSHSSRPFDYHSSTNTNEDRSRRSRPIDDGNRPFYTDSKKTYGNNSNNQRDSVYTSRDRDSYRDSDLSLSGTSMTMNSTSESSNQRYSGSSTNQHRVPDPFLNLPVRARDMALPSSSSVGSNYDRSVRNLPSLHSNDTLGRRGQSGDRSDNREYMREGDRRNRSPTSNNKMRREPVDNNQWDRPKTRDPPHYPSESHKYIPNQYLSESSSSSNHQQGLWASAPPSRPIHQHGDLPMKNSYGWQQNSQGSSQTSSTHHSANIQSSHDRSRSNLSNNQRLQMLPSNQTSTGSTQSARPSTTSQSHLYSHQNVPVGTLSSQQPQQHTALVQPPPPSMHHGASYVTQPVPATSILLHSPVQARSYDSHYVVSQPLPPQRRY